ncbi:alpha/beta fold hydrolase [Paenarthrobacter sp. 2TAF44]|uniref:alpha/beta fold hydrolase n=1 Tax=Paenarthrobacter sp. 2TAF44 TaxID=3233018 RepID=UPI003F986084
MKRSTLKLDGADIAVRESGNGPTMILVHGTGADGSTWDGVLPSLAKDHRVLDYDRRGYGSSVHPAVVDYRVHSHDLEALIEQRAAGPACLVGWSSGGTVCLDLAGRRPDLISHVVVMEAPVHGIRNGSMELFRIAARVRWLQSRGRGEEAVTLFLQFASKTVDGGNGFDRAPAESRASLLANTETILAELGASRFGPLGEYVDYKALAKSGLPITWLVGGESGRWYNRIAQDASRQIPSVRVEKVPLTSHLMHHERPEAFVRAVLGAVE